MGSLRFGLGILLVAGFCACSAGGSSGEDGIGVSPGVTAPGAVPVNATGGGATSPSDMATGSSQTLPDGGMIGPNLDAFWEDDPPPMYCGPQPAPELMSPGGTPECPDDKNREGCPCANPGETAPCWPGLRANRNRGQCKDGVATCEPILEFINTWSACEGYILPSETGTTGRTQCQCFSSGRWAIDNVTPCFITDQSNAIVAAYSTTKSPIMCLVNEPPIHDGGWSDSTLTVDCAGQFEVCFTLKAGDVNNPLPNDCVVAETCTSGFIPEPNVATPMPELPGWTSNNIGCAQQFNDFGGYGEMSVIGESVECDTVDDGSGGRRVFNRSGYCPNYCNTDDPRSSNEECMNCASGGSGSF